MQMEWNCDDFILLYESALNSQDWKELSPLIHSDACVTFSNGTVHNGKKKIRRAFEKNFSTIKNEKYQISEVFWLKKEPNFGIYIFQFHWQGLVKGNLMSGSGHGTAVIIKAEKSWKLIAEHLGN